MTTGLIMRPLVLIPVVAALGLSAIAWAGATLDASEASAIRCVCDFSSLGSNLRGVLKRKPCTRI